MTILRAQLLELDVPLPAGLGRGHVGVLLRVKVDRASIFAPALFGALEIEVRDPAEVGPDGKVLGVVDRPVTMRRADVLRELGISKSTLDRLRIRRPDFPTEFRASAMAAPTWAAAEIRAFREKLQEETRRRRADHLRRDRGHTKVRQLRPMAAVAGVRR